MEHRRSSLALWPMNLRLVSLLAFWPVSSLLLLPHLPRGGRMKTMALMPLYSDLPLKSKPLIGRKKRCQLDICLTTNHSIGFARIAAGLKWPPNGTSKAHATVNPKSGVDHLVTNKKGKKHGIHKYKNAVNLNDLWSTLIGCVPVRDKGNEETRRAYKLFAGNRKIQRIYGDNAGELKCAAEKL